jgi:YidC/Oxa1 family membrane protein insertase
MDKRLGLALAISIGILFVWWKIFPPPQPSRPATPATQVASAPAGTPTPAPSVPGTPGTPSAPAAGPEERATLETPDARYTFSSYGGTLREVRLKDPKFLEQKGNPESGLQIIRTTTAETAPLQISFTKADFKLPEQPAFAVTRPSPDTIVFRTENEVVALEKRYKALSGSYQIQLDVTVENKSAKPLNEALALHLYGHQDPSKKGGGFLSYASANPTEMVCFSDGSAVRGDVDSVRKEAREKDVQIGWIAADEKFFTVAAVPYPDNPPERKCTLRGVSELDGEAILSFATRSVAPAGKITHSFVVFAGPKYRSDLEAVQPGGVDPRLGKDINVTFSFLASPMLWLLKQFEKFTNNWGLAIILLTLFVKLVTFYPTQRTMLSAKKMQRLAPKLTALRKKFENDKQRLGVETMNLYKANGVSPFGGCLPSLIQMPIWIALFSTLNYAVELHRSSFLGYITDLSARDPYYITPLLMGAVMVVQMRMSPAGTDPQQQKMMSVMMPVMFTIFSLFLPAGLAIYTLTSYMLGILQQLWINHVDRKRNGPPLAVKA